MRTAWLTPFYVALAVYGGNNNIHHLPTANMQHTLGNGTKLQTFLSERRNSGSCSLGIYFLKFLLKFICYTEIVRRKKIERIFSKVTVVESGMVARASVKFRNALCNRHKTNVHQKVGKD